jgi:hypothetical protein
MSAYAELVAAGFPKEIAVRMLIAGGRLPEDTNPEEVAMEWDARSAAVEEAKRLEKEEQAEEMMAEAKPSRSPSGAPKFKVGDRIVSLVEHMEGMKGMAGTVNEARAGSPPYYAIDFDEPMGEGNPHKWLSEDEIRAEGGSAMDMAA